MRVWYSLNLEATLLYGCMLGWDCEYEAGEGEEEQRLEFFEDNERPKDEILLQRMVAKFRIGNRKERCSAQILKKMEARPRKDRREQRWIEEQNKIQE
ncbi:hypothetical protein VTL71DRAFT_13545 [Oculimacula yallundae]|uniref:Uncharacterized protein n=1 Tax=Oculimacula yallundae TaxID=86028 RepID=A0ABR4CN64_9HELO